MGVTISIQSVCDALSIKRTTVYKLIASGALEPVKIGAKTLITQRSVDALIARGIADAQRAWSL